MKIVGLTGSIGMGKTTTANLFRQRGIPVFDADSCVHQLQAPGGVALPAIEAAFPGVVVNGKLDRSSLRDRVFDNPEARTVLEKIIHPMVSVMRRNFLYEAEQDREPFVVLDIPLLFENGLDEDCDLIVVVSAPPDVQRERVLERANMSIETFERILASQMADQDKRYKADYVIETGKGLDVAAEQVDAFIEAILGISLSPR